MQVYFQNSTDQNYEYKTWNGISVFEQVVKEMLALSEAEILHIAESYDDEDKLDIEYYRQTTIYQKIYEMLDLKSWLWHRNGNTLNVTIGPTKNEVEWIQLQNQMTAMLVTHEFLTQKAECWEEVIWLFGKCTNTAANTDICIIGSGGTEPSVSIQKTSGMLSKRNCENKEKKEEKKDRKHSII